MMMVLVLGLMKMYETQLKANKIYWEQRAEQRLISAEQKALRLEKDMKNQFDRAYKSIENEIANLYFKYADENELSYDEAVKYLTQNQRKEFQKDLKFYIEKSKDADYSQRFNSHLKALSTRARITRLEELKLNIEYEVNELYHKHSLNTQLTFDDILDESYYKTIFDIQQFQGYGMTFNLISPNILESLLEYPWSGKNYSEKIWSNIDNLSGKLEDVLTAGIIQGKSNQEMAAELEKATNTAYKNAIRLVRTETNFIAGEATHKAYQEYGVEQYQFLATLDLRTSEICRSLDGKVFEEKDRKTGVNCHPMHPHCRSTDIPYIPDLEGTRVARGSDGKTYKVDRNMTYDEWYKKYVEGNAHELQAERMLKNKSSDKKQFEKYKDLLGSQAPKNIENFQNLKYNDNDGWKNLKTTYRIKNDIRSGKKNLRIEKGQQNKHTLGTNEYNQYMQKFKELGQYGPSRLTINSDEITDLITKYSGHGQINIKNGKWDNKEVIFNNNKIVGIAVNNLTGREAETTVFKIHYSKNGVHIVPDYPSKKR